MRITQIPLTNPSKLKQCLTIDPHINQEKLNPKESRNVLGFITPCQPEKLQNPFLAIGFQNEFSIDNFDLDLDFLSGAGIYDSFAMNYAGHQYGVYCSQLGSGRSLIIGEFDHQGQRFEISLKGTGQNCFSRNGNGKCTLDECIKQSIIAQTCKLLNIPSITPICVVGSTEKIKINGSMHSLGMMTRIAPTWIRFGTFELFYYKEMPHLVRELADFVIEHHFPAAKELSVLKTRSLLPCHIFTEQQDVVNLQKEMDDNPLEIKLNKYGTLFRMIVHQNAKLAATWQANGFVHGLLNTDHMSIVGITMPTDKSGFLTIYDPEYTPNSTDIDGEYRFEVQPSVVKWNVGRLGRCFLDLIGDSLGMIPVKVTRDLCDPPFKISQQVANPFPPKKLKNSYLFNSGKSENIMREILNEYDEIFVREFRNLMCLKLGISIENDEEEISQSIIQPLLDMMAETGVDYFKFFKVYSNMRWDTESFQEMHFDEDERHSQQELLSCEPNDIMTLFLKALAIQLDGSNENIAEPVISSQRGSMMAKRSGASSIKKTDASIVLAQLNHLPNLMEMASKIKYWIVVLQQKLLGQEWNEWHARVCRVNDFPVIKIDDAMRNNAEIAINDQKDGPSRVAQ